VVTRIEAVVGGAPPRESRSISVTFDRPLPLSSDLVLLAGWVADAEDYQPEISVAAE
jgi:hypothetical protein